MNPEQLNSRHESEHAKIQVTSTAKVLSRSQSRGSSKWINTRMKSLLAFWVGMVALCAMFGFVSSRQLSQPAKSSGSLQSVATAATTKVHLFEVPSELPKAIAQSRSTDGAAGESLKKKVQSAPSRAATGPSFRLPRASSPLYFVAAGLFAFALLILIGSFLYQTFAPTFVRRITPKFKSRLEVETQPTLVADLEKQLRAKSREISAINIEMDGLLHLWQHSTEEVEDLKKRLSDEVKEKLHLKEQLRLRARDVRHLEERQERLVSLLLENQPKSEEVRALARAPRQVGSSLEDSEIYFV